MTRILRYWPVGGNQVVVHATLAGPGVTKANNTALLLRQSDGFFFPLLRTGDLAPGCLLSSVNMASILTVEVDPVNGHYAIVGGLTGAAATANLALWTGQTLHPDSNNTTLQHLRRPILRLRKGDAYSSGGTPRDVIRGITLKPVPDPTGAGGRGLGQAVSRTGLVAVTLTGDRRIQELVTIQP